MARIEKRRNQHRVFERTVDGMKVHEPFTSREVLFIDLLQRISWAEAVAFVEQPTEAAPAQPMLVSAAVAVIASAELGGRPVYDQLRERLARV